MDVVSSGLQVAYFAFQISQYIYQFAKDVQDYDGRMDDLAEKIEKLGKRIAMAQRLRERLQSMSDPHRNLWPALEEIDKGITKSERILRDLTRHRLGLGQPFLMTTFEKVLKHLCYEVGGKSDIETALKALKEGIQDVDDAITNADRHIALDIHETLHQGERPKITRDNSDNSSGAQSVTSGASDIASIFSFRRTDSWNSKTSSAGSIFSRSETLNERDAISIVPSLSPTLILAINKTNPTAVRTRLDEGDLILDKDIDGLCALHHAVKAGGKRALRELLKSEQVKDVANAINEPDNSGATALHHAASMGKLEIAKELIEAGANMEAVDYYQRSPLHHAVKGNHESLVELLVDRGARPTASLPLRFKEMQSSITYRKRMKDKEAKKFKSN